MKIEKFSTVFKNDLRILIDRYNVIIIEKTSKGYEVNYLGCNGWEKEFLESTRNIVIYPSKEIMIDELNILFNVCYHTNFSDLDGFNLIKDL